MQRYRSAFVLMLLIVLCLSNIGAARIPARLLVSLAQTSNDPLVDALVLDAVYEGLVDTLSWRLALDSGSKAEFNAIIRDLYTNQTIFPGKPYISFILDLSWEGNELSQLFTILGTGRESLDKTVRTMVGGQLRYDLLALVKAPPDSMVLDYVHGSSMSLVGSTKFLLGEKVLVTDFDGQEIASAKVSDIILVKDNPEQTVVELGRISANGNLEPGMLVVKEPSQWDVMLSLPISLDGFGIEAEMTLPLRSSSGYYSFKGGGWATYTSFGGSYDVTLLARAGVGANFVISSPSAEPRSLFSDISLGFVCRVGVGVQFMQSTTARFLYGTEVEFTFNQHLSSRFSWGLVAGYRFWVFPDAGNFQAIHANEKGLLLAPFIGLSW
jgi:hypothetical protein